MALTARASSSFMIYVQNDQAAAKTIANTRAMTVVAVRVFNTGGTPAFQLTNGSADIVASTTTVAGGWKSMPITTTNASITTQNLVIAAIDTTTTQVIIECIADAGYDLTVT